MYYNQDIHNKLLQIVHDAKILCVHIGGSKSWNCKNPHDTDLIVVTDKNCGTNITMINSEYGLLDVFIYPYDEWCEKLAFANAELLKQHPDKLLYGDIPTVNKTALDFLLQQYKYSSRTHFIGNKYQYCPKRMYWTLMAYYAVINGKFEFAEEQMDIIQKCHDGELPISYRDELKEKVEETLRSYNLI